ncbi:MAG: hypothetical protein J5857_01625 [Treponema sp.]|nr:hypothetical protein [Treponema sp.]
MQIGIETDMDKYIKMAAEIKAQCILMRNSGFCTKEKCLNCEIEKSRCNYMQMMSPLEKQYVDVLALRIAQEEGSKNNIAGKISHRNKPIKAFLS